MSLIFDRFETEADARLFAARVDEVFPGRDPTVYLSQDESDRVDPFPFVLSAPIVLVDRFHDDTNDAESAVRALVGSFGGEFAGT